jgi:3-oxoacyl-[acyl-carrier-protein] synthase-3
MTSGAVRTRIESLGLYLPEKEVTTKELVAELSVPLLIDFETMTGIRSRRMRAKDEDNLTLGVAAARDCLRHSRYSAADIDVVVNCTITRCREYPTYYLEPAMSRWIKRALGAERALNFDIANACAGMFTGVYLLDHMIKAGMVRNGLVVSGDLLTPITETAVKDIETPFDEQLASLSVGDAGAAVIVDQSPDGVEGIDYVDLMTCAQHSDLCLGMPSLKSHGISLYTKHNKLHHRQNMLLWPHLQEHIQQRRGVPFEAEHFDYVILHQIGTKFSEKALSLVRQHFTSTTPTPLTCVEELGNTASTSHFVVLYRHLQSGTLRKGHRVLLVPSASGVVVGSMAVTLGELEVESWAQ